MQNKNEWVDAWLRAWANQDLNVLAAFYHRDFCYLDPSLESEIVDKEIFKKYVGKLQKIYPDWKWVRVEFFGEGGKFCLKWKASFDQNTEIMGLDLIELKDGLITRNEVYFDRGALG